MWKQGSVAAEQAFGRGRKGVILIFLVGSAPECGVCVCVHVMRSGEESDLKCQFRGVKCSVH